MQQICVPAIGDTPELNKQRAELDKEAADIATSSGALDAEEHSYRSGPPEDLISGTAESIRDRRLNLMAREIRLREKITVFDNDCRDAMRVKSRALNGELESVRGKVVNALARIGFERPISGIPTVVTPGLIGAHPLVRSAAARMREAQEQSNDTALQQRNAAAINELKTRMERIRDRQLATV